MAGDKFVAVGSDFMSIFAKTHESQDKFVAVGVLTVIRVRVSHIAEELFVSKRREELSLSLFYFFYFLFFDF